MKFGTSKRTFEFTVEKSESYTIQRTFRITALWCRNCGYETRMSRPEDAARITGISTRKIYTQIEDGKAHFTESPDGSLMVCLRSLCEHPAKPKLDEGETE